jgi:selenocysteine lyase/cysteine desulfurase
VTADVDWVRIRRRFPAVERSTYLNTAAGAPVSRAAAEAGRRYYDLTLSDGDVHWDAWLEEVERIRRHVASMLGVGARQVAFLANASAGMNVVAQMWRGDGGQVVSVRDEFPSCTLPWLQLGYEVAFATPREDGSFGAADLDAARTESSRIVVVSHVQYVTGFRADLAALGSYCRARGLRLVVDATQSFGAFPVAMGGENESVDAVVFSGYKWPAAGYGVAVLALARRHLDPGRYPVAGWRSARDPHAMCNDRLDLSPRAAALEQGHPPFPGVFALGAALELVQEVGIDAISRRILELVERLIGGLERLAGQGVRVVTVSDARHRSGIVSFAVPDPEATVDRLRADDIHVSARGRAVRVSLHHYNDAADVDRLLAALPVALESVGAPDA